VDRLWCGRDSQDSTGDSTIRAFGTLLTRLTCGFKPKPRS